MGQIKGQLDTGSTTTKDVTVTENSNKVALDVNITGTSPGAAATPNGSLTEGLTYLSIFRTETSTEDIYSYYSDSAGTSLLSTITITYTDSTKKTLSSVVRNDA